MSPEASKFLEYLDRNISEQERIILAGALGGTTSDQVAVNYKATTLYLGNLKRIRLQFVEDFTKKSAEEEGDGLQEMPDNEGK